MNSMFRNASAFDQNLGSWDVGKVRDMVNMFNDAGLSRQNYDALLAGWTQIEYRETPLLQSVMFHAGNSQYCNSEARALLIDFLSWGITDGGLAANCPPPAPRANQLSVASLLVPPGLSIGTQVRLLFVDGNINFGLNDISDYNNEVITVAAESNSVAIRRFSDQFRALISSDTVDARDNTATTYTAEDPDVPIYWVGGDKVADNYADFYDGSWGSRNARNSSGNLVNTAGLNILTGSNAAGVGLPNNRVGDRSNGVRVGRLDSADAEIDSGMSNNRASDPLYGLSPVLTLVSVGPQPPVAQNPIPNQMATAREEFSYTFPENVFYDINMDELTYRVTAPPWLTIDPSNSRTITGTPPSAAVGQSPIYVTVVASDGNPITADASSAFLLTVGPNDQAPPANVRAVAGDGSITVSWDPLVEDGGFPISSYQVTVFRRSGSPRSASCATFSPTATSCTVIGLVNGVVYNRIVVTALRNNPRANSATSIDDVLIPRSSADPIPPENTFVTTWRFNYNINERITIPTHSSSNYSYTVDWGDGSIDDTIYTGDATHDYSRDPGRSSNYIITISGTFPRIYFNNSGDKEKIWTIRQWGNTAWTSMENSFYGCNNLSIEASAGQPDLSSVRSTKGMFRDAARIDQPMNDWDVSSVSNMEDMFNGADEFNQSLSAWNVSNVTDMSSMFNGATRFNQSLISWNVSTVTDTSSMFNDAVKFNQDLSAWNVSSVTDMSDMFNGAVEFNQDLGAWNVSSVADMSGMLTGVTLSTANYDSLLAGWGRIEDGEMALQEDVVFNAGGSQYCDQEARDILDNAPNNWDINDGGQLTVGCSDPSAFVTTWRTFRINRPITIPTNDNFTYNYTVDWGDGTKTTGHTGDATHTYVANETYTITITGTFPTIYFNNSGDRTLILTVEQWGNRVWQSMEGSFRGTFRLSISADAGSPDLSSVTSMRSTFWGSGSDLQIGHWDVSNVTDMSQMFLDNPRFNQPLGDWNVSKVTDMSRMFDDATGFNQPLGNWDVGKVTDMSRMFDDATGFNQPLGNWDVGKVTDMSRMFNNATRFNQPLGNWDVSKVTDMSRMFDDATRFNYDLGAWDVGQVTDMSDMFNNAPLSHQNYDALLAGWSRIEDGETSLRSTVMFSAGNSQYCNQDARDILTNPPNSWRITDGGPNTSGACTLQFAGNTNIANQVYTVGNAVTLLLPSIRGGATPLTYSLEPLPPGLTIFPQTVDTAPLLTGTPSVAMPATTVTYTVTAADGSTVMLPFIIAVVNSLPPETLTLGTVSNVDLNLKFPVLTGNGEIYYYLDVDNNGEANPSDLLNHAALDNLLNNGSDTIDTQEGEHDGSDDERSVTVGAYTLILPTLTELRGLRAYQRGTYPSNWGNGFYNSATGDSVNPDQHRLFDLGDASVMVADDHDASLKAYVAFQVLSVIPISFDQAEYTIVEDTTGTIILRADQTPVREARIRLTAGSETVADDEYQLSTTVIVFEPDQDTASFEVSIFDDDVIRSTRQLRLSLDSLNSNATRGTTPETVINVENNDTSFVTLEVAGDDTTLEEGDSTTLQITLERVFDYDTTIDIVRAGAATQGDYTIGMNPIRFPAYSTYMETTLTVTNDGLVESNETIILRLASNNNLIITNRPEAQQTLTIVDRDVPAISFEQAEYTIIEDTTGTIILRAEQTPVRKAQISLTTASDTVRNDEYRLSTTVIVFEPGQSTASFGVSILDDEVIRSPRELFLSFVPFNNSATRGTTPETVINVENNDMSSVTLTVTGDALTLEEGNSTTLQITLERAFDQDTTIRIVSGGTATQGGDYTINVNPLMFPAYSTYAETTLTITSDGLVEADETIILRLETDNDLIITNRPEAQLTLTIEDRDVPAISFEQAEYTIVEGTASTIILRAEQTPVREAQISLTTRSETVRNDEYRLSTTVIVFEPGQSTRSFTVSIVDDDVIRSPGKLSLSFESLNNSAARGAVPETVINVENNDMSSATLTVAEDNIVFEEGDSTTLRITLARAFDQDTTIRIVTAGTATQGEDYTIDMNPLMFPAYSTYAETTLTITNDGLVEANETIILRLEANNELIITNRPEARLTLTIADRDVPAISFEQAEYTIVEGTEGTIILRAEQIPVREAQISLIINPGTVPNAAYSLNLPATGLVFMPGQSTVSFTVSISDDIDTADADADTISLSLGELRLSFVPINNSAGRGTIPETVINIKNDDTSPATLAVTGNALTLGEGDSTTLRITLARAFDQDTTIRIVTAGTATQGDYTIDMNSLMFPAYSTYTETTLTVTNDSLVEPNETIILRLETDNDSIITNRPEAQLTLTIADNDVPAISFEQAEYTIVVGTTGTIILRADQTPVREARISLTINSGTVSEDEYSLSTTVVVFESGQSTTSFEVSIVDDDVIRSPRELRLSLDSLNSDATRGTTPETVINVENNDRSSATLTVAGDTVLEEGDSTTLRITLARAFDQDTTIRIVTAGTATQVDYTIDMNSLRFPAYSTYTETTLTVTNDSLVEPNETIILRLETDNDLIIVNRPEAQLTLTIEDNDVPEISFEQAEYTIVEGTIGTIILRADQTPVREARVSLTINPGTVSIDAYRLSTTVVVFEPGQNTASFTVSISADIDTADADADAISPSLGELRLSFAPLNNSAVLGATPETVINIKNDDISPATLAVAGDTAFDEGDSTTLRITLARAFDQDTTIDIRTAGTATQGKDYNIDMNSLMFPAYSTYKETTLTVTNDILVELDETIILTLETDNDLIITDRPEAQLTLTITDRDIAVISFEQAEYTIVEGTTGTIILRAEQIPLEAVLINLTTSATTVTDDEYRLSTTVIVFEPGQSTASFEVSILDDDIIRSPGKLSLSFVPFNNSAARGTTPETVINVENNDVSSATLTIAGDTVLEEGDSTTLRITLARAFDQDTTIGIVSTGTATQGEDYDYTIDMNPLMFSAYSTYKETTLTVTNDILVELDETIILTLNANNDLIITDRPEAQLTLTIEDNDVPAISFEQAEYTIDEGTTGTIILRADQPPVREARIRLTTRSDTIENNEYRLSATVIVFERGQSTASFDVSILDDAVVQSIRELSLSFELSDDNAMYGVTSETAITITDNDGLSLSTTRIDIAENGDGSVIIVEVREIPGASAIVRVTVSGNRLEAIAEELIFTDSTTQSLTIRAINDEIYAGSTINEITFRLVTTGQEETLTVLITEDDPIVTVAPSELRIERFSTAALVIEANADVGVDISEVEGLVLVQGDKSFSLSREARQEVVFEGIDEGSGIITITVQANIDSAEQVTTIPATITTPILSIDAPATIRFADNVIGELAISVSASGGLLPSAGMQARLRITTEGSTVRLDESALVFMSTAPQTVMLEALGLGVTTLTLTAGEGNDGYTETSATVVVEVIDRLSILVAGDASEAITLTEGQSTDVAVTLNRLADSVTVKVMTDRGEIMTANNLVFDSLSTETLTITSLPVDSYEPSRDIEIELSAAGYTTATVMVRIVEEEVPLSIDAPTTIQFADNVIGELAISVSASGGLLPSAGIPAMLRITTEGSTVQLDKSVLEFMDTNPQTVMLEALGLGVTTLTLTAGVGMDGYTETSATVVVEVIDRLRILVAGDASETVTLTEGQSTDVAVTLNRLADSVTVTVKTDRGEVMTANNLVFDSLSTETLTITSLPVDSYDPSRDIAIELSAAGYTTATITVRIVEEEVPLSIDAPETLRFADNEDGELSISVSASEGSLPSAGIPARLRITTEGSTVQLDKSALVFMDTAPQTVMLEALGLGITTLTLTAGEGNDGYTETSATVVVEVIDRLRILVAGDASESLVLLGDEGTDVAVMLNRLGEMPVTVTVTVSEENVITVADELVFVSGLEETLNIAPMSGGMKGRTVELILSAAGYTTATVMVTPLEEEMPLSIDAPETIRFADNEDGELPISVNASRDLLPSAAIPAVLQITATGETVRLIDTKLEFTGTQTQTVMLEALGLGVTTLTLTAGVGIDGYTETSATVVVEVIDRLRILVEGDVSESLVLLGDEEADVAVMLNRLEEMPVTVTVTVSEENVITVADELVFVSGLEETLNIAPMSGGMKGRTIELTLSAAGYTTATVIVRVLEEEVPLDIDAPTTIRFAENEDGELAISVSASEGSLPSAGIPAMLRITATGETVRLIDTELEFTSTQTQTVSLEALGLGVTTLTLTAGVGTDGYTETSATVVVEVIDRLGILVAGDASETVTLIEGQSTDVAVTLNRLADSVTVTVVTDRGEIMTVNNLVFDSLSTETLTITSLPVDSYEPSRDIEIELSAAGYTTATVMVRIVEEEVPLSIDAPTTIQFADNVMGELAISVSASGGSLPSAGIPAMLRITTEGSTVQLDKSVLEFMDTDPQTVSLEALGLGVTTLTLTAGVGMDGYTETSATVVVEVIDRLRILVAGDASETVTLTEGQSTDVAVTLNRLADSVTVTVKTDRGEVMTANNLVFDSLSPETLTIESLPVDSYDPSRDIAIELSAAGYTTATVMVRIVEEEVPLSIDAPETIRFADNVMGELAISVSASEGSLPSAGIPAMLRITTEGSTVQLDKSALVFMDTAPQMVMLEALGLGVTTLTLTADEENDGYTETSATVVVEVIDRLRILVAGDASESLVLLGDEGTDVAVMLNRLGEMPVTVTVTVSEENVITVADELVFVSGLEETLNIAPMSGGMKGRTVELTLSAAGYTTATVMVTPLEEEVPLSIDAPETIRFADNEDGELPISVNASRDLLPSAAIPAVLQITATGETVRLIDTKLEFTGTQTQTVMLEALGLGVTTLTLTAGVGIDGYTETSATVVVEVIDRLRILVEGDVSESLVLLGDEEADVAVMLNRLEEMPVTVTVTVSEENVITVADELVFVSGLEETLNIAPMSGGMKGRTIELTLSATGYTTATVIVRVLEEEVPLDIDAPTTIRFAENEDGELAISVSASGGLLPSAGIPAMLRITATGETVRLIDTELEFTSTQTQTVSLEALGLGVTTLTLTAGVGTDGYTETSATVVVEVIDRLRILVAGDASEAITLTEGRSTDVAVTLNRLADSVTVTVVTDRGEIMTANNLVFDSLSTATLTITSLPVDSYEPSRDIAIELSAAGYTTATVMVRIVEEEVSLSIDAPETIRFAENEDGELAISVSASGGLLPSAGIPARLEITTEGETVRLIDTELEFTSTQTRTVMLEALGLGVTTLTLTAGVGMDGYTETSATVVVEVIDRLRILVAGDASETVTLTEGQSTDVAVTLNRLADSVTVTVKTDRGEVMTANNLVFDSLSTETLTIESLRVDSYDPSRDIAIELSAAGYTTATVMVRIVEEEVPLSIDAPETIRFADNVMGELAISVSASEGSLPSAGIPARLRITTEGSTVQLDKSALVFMDTAPQTVMLEALGLGVTTLTLTADEENDGYTETSATVVVEVIDRLRILVAGDASESLVLLGDAGADVAVMLNRLEEMPVTVTVTVSEENVITVADELVFVSGLEETLNIAPVSGGVKGRTIELILSAAGYTTATVMVTPLEEEVSLSIDAPETIRFADNMFGELPINVSASGSLLPSAAIPALLQITATGETVGLIDTELEFTGTQTQTVMLEALGLGVTTLTLTAGVGIDGYTETSATVVVEVIDRLRILVAGRSSETITLTEGEITDVAVTLNRLADSVTVTVTTDRSEIMTTNNLVFDSLSPGALTIESLPVDSYEPSRDITIELSAAGYTTATITVRIVEEEVQLDIDAPTTIRFADNKDGELAISVSASGGSLPSAGIPAMLRITTEGSTVQLDKSALVFMDTDPQTVMLEALGLGVTTLTLAAGAGNDGYTETSATVVVEVIDRLRILVAGDASGTLVLLGDAGADVAVMLNRLEEMPVTVTVTVSEENVITVADELVFVSGLEETLNIAPMSGGVKGRTIELTLSAAGYTTATVMVTPIEEEVPLSIEAPETIRFTDNVFGELPINVSASGSLLPNAAIPAVLEITATGGTVRLIDTELEFTSTQTQTVMLEALGLGVTTLTLTAGVGMDGYTETSATVVVEVIDRLRILVAGDASEAITLTEGENTDVAVTLNRLADSVTVTVVTDRGEIMTANNLVFDSLSTETLTIESLRVDSYDPSRDIAIELSAAGYTTATVMVRIVEEEVQLDIDAPETIRFAENEDGELSISVSASGGSLPSAGIPAMLRITTEGSTVQLDKSALVFMDTDPQTVMLEALGLGVTTLTLTAGAGNDGYTETSATVVVEVIDRLRILVAGDASESLLLLGDAGADVAVMLNRLEEMPVTVTVTVSEENVITVADELVFVSGLEEILNIAPMLGGMKGRTIELTLSAAGYTTATVMVTPLEEEVPLSIDAPTMIRFTDNVFGELPINVSASGSLLPSAAIPAVLRITATGETVGLIDTELEFMGTQTQTVSLEALGLGVTTLTLTAGVGMDGYTETSATVVVEVIDRLRILVAGDASEIITLMEGESTDVAVRLNRLADSVTVTVVTDRGEIMTANNLVFDSLSTETLTIESLRVDSYDPSRDIAIELSAAGYTTATVTVRIVEEEVQLDIDAPETIRFMDNEDGELAISVSASGGLLPSAGIPARLRITTEGSTVQLDKSALVFMDTDPQTVSLEALGLGVTTLTLTAGEGDDGYTETSTTVVVEVIDRLRILVAGESNETLVLLGDEGTDVAVMLNRLEEMPVTVTVTVSEENVITVADELVFVSGLEETLNIAPMLGGIKGRTVELTLSAAGYTTATLMVTPLEEELPLSIDVPTTIRFTDNVFGALPINVSASGSLLPNAAIPAVLQITATGETVGLIDTELEFTGTQTQTVMLEALGLGVTTLTLTAGVGIDGYTETSVTVVVEVIDRLRILVAGDASEAITLTEGESTEVAVTLNRLADSVTVTVVTDRGEIMTANNLVFDSLSTETLTIESLRVDSYEPSRDIATELSAAGYTTATITVRIVEEEVPLRIDAPTTIRFTDNVMGELAISVSASGDSLPSAGIPAVLQITATGETVGLIDTELVFMDTDPQTVSLEALGLGVTTLTLTAGMGMDGYTETSATVVVEVIDRLRILVAGDASESLVLLGDAGADVAVMLNRLEEMPVTVTVTVSEENVITVEDELVFVSGLEETLNIAPVSGGMKGRTVELTLSAAGYTTATVMVTPLEEEVPLSIEVPTTIRFADNVFGELPINVSASGSLLPNVAIPAVLQITATGGTVGLIDTELEFTSTQTQTVSLEALGLGVTTLTLTAGVGIDGYTETSATVVVEVIEQFRPYRIGFSTTMLELVEEDSTMVAVQINSVSSGEMVSTIAATIGFTVSGGDGLLLESELDLSESPTAFTLTAVGSGEYQINITSIDPDGQAFVEAGREKLTVIVKRGVLRFRIKVFLEGAQ